MNNKKLLKNVTWELRRAEKYCTISILINIILTLIVAIQAIKLYIN
jgi:hypothetical protein